VTEPPLDIIITTIAILEKISIVSIIRITFII
jgi:hypothetical protein